MLTVLDSAYISCFVVVVVVVAVIKHHVPKQFIEGRPCISYCFQRKVSNDSAGMGAGTWNSELRHHALVHTQEAESQLSVG